MDTLNDGTPMTYKMILPLFNVTKTGPWTWHGWQTDLRKALRFLLTSTLQGEEPNADDVEALYAFLESIETPPNPFRQGDGTLSPEARRGKALFSTERAGCSHCHKGPYFSDDEIHDVGLGSRKDAYKGFNPPGLVGVYQRVCLLHDGRAISLEDVLTRYHSPPKVSERDAFSTEELHDLIEYLKSL